MKPTTVELADEMKEVLEALERNEEVPVFHRGQLKGVIVPMRSKKKFIPKNHPLFGIDTDDKRSVEEVMRDLRKPRYSNLW